MKYILVYLPEGDLTRKRILGEYASMVEARVALDVERDAETEAGNRVLWSGVITFYVPTPYSSRALHVYGIQEVA